MLSDKNTKRIPTDPAALSMAAQALHADAVAAASAVGSMFSGENEVELAFLMRLVAEGDTATASRIAQRFLAARAPRPAEADAPVVRAAGTHRRARSLQPPGPDCGPSSLSPREISVLRMLSQGLSNKQIAESSYRSTHTVDAQVKNIYRKLAVKSRAHAVHEGMQKGLLDPDAQGSGPQDAA